MTVASEVRPNATAPVEKRLPVPGFHSVLVVAVVAFGVFWPGGRAQLLDLSFSLVVLALLYYAVTRHRSFVGLVDAAPTAAKWGARIVLSAFLIGQLWSASAQTFPIASWTMYSQNPGDNAFVYRFDAVDAAGEPVAFTPSATNRTLPAKMALVHLRNLSSDLYHASLASDDEAIAASEDTLRRTIVTYVEMHNEVSSGPEPVSVEVSRVTFDITQPRVTVDSGEATQLLIIDLLDAGERS